MSEATAALGANPFTLLSLIAAPAVLTNAASLLVLSTSNRFARTIDRGRSLAAELQKAATLDADQIALRLRQLHRAEKRSILLLHSLRLFYLSLGSFAAASLVSVIGAGVANATSGLVLRAFVFISTAAGVVGVGSLVFGCTVLVRETRLAVYSITEEANILGERFSGVGTQVKNGMD
jgi:hypothetical protein